MTSIAGEITEACDSWSGAFENCYFLAGELKITTRNQSLNGVFTNAAISGDPLIYYCLIFLQQKGRYRTDFE